ncbi:MAG TPA: YciI family protein [Microthrixaceae bacterium]|nr:YciI family protein [Microthrixaceae bacterium]
MSAAGTVPAFDRRKFPMTQYMLSVHHDSIGAYEGADLTPDDMQRMYQQVDAFNNEVQAAGAWVFGGGLTLPDSATTVRNKSGELLITDGPYAETKEVLGGFWIIEAADLDEALAWARKGALACEGDVEIRPFQDEPS